MKRSLCRSFPAAIRHSPAATPVRLHLLFHSVDLLYFCARLSGLPADRFQTASWLILHNRNYTEPLEGDHSGLLTPSDCPVTGNDIAPALAGNRTMTSLQNRTALHVTIASSYASRCPRRIGAACRNRTGSCTAYGATVQRALHQYNNAACAPVFPGRHRYPQAIWDGLWPCFGVYRLQKVLSLLRGLAGTARIELA